MLGILDQTFLCCTIYHHMSVYHCRMSKEVFKCHTQLNDLHAELGADNIANWTADHAKEVLSSEEYYLWREHQEETTRELEQLKMEGSQADDSDTSDDVSH